MVFISGSGNAGCYAKTADDRPQMGGILIWKDKCSFIRFEKGVMSPDRVSIGGYSGGKWQLTGQGLMKTHSTYMRVERSESQFNAFCSMDGENWMKCGIIDLEVDDPLQVGIYALGYIDRAFCYEEYREGTATLFKNFRLWSR